MCVCIYKHTYEIPKLNMTFIELSFFFLSAGFSLVLLMALA